jgi:hypothetical protein
MPPPGTPQDAWTEARPFGEATSATKTRNRYDPNVFRQALARAKKTGQVLPCPVKSIFGSWISAP